MRDGPKFFPSWGGTGTSQSKPLHFQNIKKVHPKYVKDNFRNLKTILSVWSI